VRLTPSGGADRIDGVGRGADGKLYIKARVRAAPEHGQANAALEALLAKALGVAKSNVSVERGVTARLKTVAIEGVSEAEIATFVAKQVER
jgi:uncharacterized protein YggU (UPF0235/DUF167 family)